MIGRRTRLLARTAFERFFENDLFSSSVSASNGALWLIAALATPGVMFSGSQYYFYAHARTFTPDVQDRILFVSQAFHVHFAMAIAAVVTMLVWTSLTPDRRDALVLGPLPLRPGEQARARLIALTRFVAMFAAAVSVPTAVAFTFVTMGDAGVVALLSRIAGHIVAVGLGAAFVFFVLVDTQLLLAATAGPGVVRLATLPFQALALAGLVGAVSSTGGVADALLIADRPDGWVLWNPAAWFVGLYRVIAGEERAIFAALAARGLLSVLTAIGVAALVYPLAHQRCVNNLLAGEGRRAGRWSGVLSRAWLRCLRPWLRTPLEHGLAAFIAATFSRNHAHRFLIGSYVGLGMLFALPLARRLLGPVSSAAEMFAWFSVPLGLLCWTAAGLRVAMMLPVEPASNWLFKITEPVDKRRVLATVIIVMRGATAVPLALVFGVGATVAGGVVLGLTVLAVVLAAGIALIELLTLTMRTVPATCTYRPGQLRLRLLWPLYLMVWTIVAYVLPRLATPVIGDWTGTAILIGGLTACAAAIRWWRVTRVRRIRVFVYEAPEPAAATTLDLSSARV